MARVGCGYWILLGCLLAGLAGINVISGPGILDYILTQSLEKLLLDHEACGMALRLVRGVTDRSIDLLPLMTDLIKTGELLSHANTRENWRQELSVSSKIIDRDTYSDWQAKGRLSALDRAGKEVERHIQETPEVSLASDLAAELEKIIRTGTSVE